MQRRMEIYSSLTYKELSNKITMVKIKTECHLNEDSGRYLKTNHHGATIILLRIKLHLQN